VHGTVSLHSERVTKVVNIENILASLSPTRSTSLWHGREIAVSGLGSEIRRWPKTGSRQAVRRCAGSRNGSRKDRPGSPRHSPRSDCIRARTRPLENGRSTARSSGIWDGGFFVSLGDRQQAKRWSFETVAEAIEWLKETACRVYPESDFARKYGGSVAQRFSRGLGDRDYLRLSWGR
jgi:hypothetical protein